MHKKSYEIIKDFTRKHLHKDRPLKILDVGSFDVNGTYRPIFDNPEWEYTGLDMVTGPNVDVVAKSLYDFGLPEGEYDVVISGNTIEHIEAIWLWVKGLAFVLKRGGWLCITSPTKIHIHRYPIDCWRVMPDGMKYLIGQCAGLDVLSCGIDKKARTQDVFCIARKA